MINLRQKNRGGKNHFLKWPFGPLCNADICQYISVDVKGFTTKDSGDRFWINLGKPSKKKIVKLVTSSLLGLKPTLPTQLVTLDLVTFFS